MKAVNEGRIGITDSVIRHWDLCIQCRACEVACPSGVPYGNLIEATMQQVADKRKPNFVNDKIASLALKRLLPNQGLLSMVVGSMRLYQRLGVQTAIRKSGLLRLLPGNMGELEGSMPELPSEVFKAQGQAGQHERRWESAKEQNADLTLEAYYEEMGKRVPIGRVGEAREAGDLVTFLVSDRAAYITGVAVNIDGGTSPVV
ncbi:Probable glycolate oxidase iron-sulfur subunit [Geodia barretti]|uniref:Probable glycolate oxidase iron-sulfur subunit n=1 Tax=Geodia barretti TaxID=519541 RepID=A0AA35WKD6_GEOBA|nr:Probable glycolate oxidase iron-sulfur subunit [Geodia barretti]